MTNPSDSCPWYFAFTHLQVLNFAVKLALRQPEDTRVQSLASFVLEMARFDLSHDLRDRARFMTAMLGLATADEGVDEAALLALNAKAGQVRGLCAWVAFARSRGGSGRITSRIRTAAKLYVLSSYTVISFRYHLRLCSLSGGT